MSSHKTIIPDRLCHKDRPICILNYPVKSPLTGETLRVPDTQDADDAVYHHAESLGRLVELPWAKTYTPVGDGLPDWAKQKHLRELEDLEDE